MENRFVFFRVKRERKREREKEREGGSKLYRCKERGSGGEQCAERDGELEGRWGGGHQPESIYRVAVHLYLLSYCLFNLFLLSILEAFKFSFLFINEFRYLYNCVRYYFNT